MTRKLSFERNLPHWAAAVALIAVAGCAGAAVRSAEQRPGAASARQAVDEFLRAVRAEDIQAMSAVWGTSRGPTRDNMDRVELEKRAVILQCFLAHEQFRVVSETPGESGRRVIRVALTRGRYTRQPALYTVQGPAGRWYVENVDLAAVRDFCGDPGNVAPPPTRPASL